MKQITIKALELDNNHLKHVVEIDGREEVITTTLSANVMEYAVTDRIDAIVLGLILFAIRNGYDIDSSIPVTDTLLYNLNHHFISTIAATRGLHHVKLQAPTISPVERMASIVSTGVSCGVDSLFTICHHTHESVPVGYKLSHLTFLNIGSHRGENGVSKSIFEGRRKHVEKICLAIGLPIIEISSDLPDFLDRHDPERYSHLNYHTFMALSAMLNIGKGLSRYYYSSGYSYRDFDCRYPAQGELDSALFDLLSLRVASTDNLEFSSFGGDTPRIDKVAYLARYPQEASFLNVCVMGADNCGKCFKCQRTLLEIDALKQLDVFESAFDIPIYLSNRNKSLQWLYIQYLKGDPYAAELMPYMNAVFTPGFKMKALVHKMISVIKNRL